MKKCPYCAESIQDEAVKCRFCGESLAKPKQDKEHFKPYFLIIAFCSVGPFMLPLIWFHPTLSRTVKIILSAIIIAITVLLVFLLIKAAVAIFNYCKQIFSFSI